MLQRLTQWLWVHVRGVVLTLTVTISAFLLLYSSSMDLGFVRWCILGVVSTGQRVFRLPIHLAALEQENRYLRTRLLSEVIRETDLEELRLESRRLEAMLGFREASPMQLLAARVLARDAEVAPTSIMVDAGRRQGVRPNQAVLAPEGLVGRVDPHPGSGTAIVRVLTDPGLRVSVVMGNPDRPMGILRWDGEKMRVENVSQESKVAVGDAVITSGLGGIFPKGLYVGRVIAVRDDPHALFKEIVIRPGARLDRLEEVFIVRRVPEAFQPDTTGPAADAASRDMSETDGARPNVSAAETARPGNRGTNAVGR